MFRNGNRCHSRLRLKQLSGCRSLPTRGLEKAKPSEQPRAGPKGTQQRALSASAACHKQCKNFQKQLHHTPSKSVVVGAKVLCDLEEVKAEEKEDRIGRRL